MAWPFTARDFTFANGVYVPSSTLNEMQDRIIDLHESHTEDIWVDLAASMLETTSADWILEANTAIPPYPADPTAHEPAYKAQGANVVFWCEIADWPELMTLNSVDIDWISPTVITTYGLRAYFARQIWPAGSGSARTFQSLNSGADYIQASGSGARSIGTFTPDQNNTLWSHENHKLVITINAGDNSGDDMVLGIRLNVTWYGTNKWATITP